MIFSKALLRLSVIFNKSVHMMNCVLLPTDDDDVLQISRPFYSHSIIKNYYVTQREELRRLAKYVAPLI